jgi:hypothetical protein
VAQILASPDRCLELQTALACLDAGMDSLGVAAS